MNYNKVNTHLSFQSQSLGFLLFIGYLHMGWWLSPSLQIPHVTSNMFSHSKLALLTETCISIHCFTTLENRRVQKKRISLSFLFFHWSKSLFSKTCLFSLVSGSHIYLFLSNPLSSMKTEVNNPLFWTGLWTSKEIFWSLGA